MSVLIKDMEMPSNCNDCDIDFCIFKYEARDDISETRSDHCPLVEVPTPHGRLIDADVIEKSMLKHLGISDKKYFLAQEKDFLKLIEQEETIIESEVDE